jgi:hypothetical protein
VAACVALYSFSGQAAEADSDGCRMRGPAGHININEQKWKDCAFSRKNIRRWENIREHGSPIFRFVYIDGSESQGGGE